MLTEALDNWAVTVPDRVRFTYLSDDGTVVRLNNAQLRQRARAIASELIRRGSPGDRVLLAYPPGVDFITGFFGCLYAGMLAVPVNYPKPRRPMPRHAAIAQDCSAAMALTTAQTLELLDTSGLPNVQWIASDGLDGQPPGDGNLHQAAGDEVAFLQYTSGSTSEPKGVMVSHANLLHNLKTIHTSFNLAAVPPERRVVLTWVPTYHDMGLIGSLLGAFYNDGETICLSPASFLQRPIRWLRAISEHRATITGAPSFAYDLTAEKATPQDIESLDLSCLYLAGCGSEPVYPEALERFSKTFAPCGFDPETLYPCYGLAESTLVVTGALGPSGVKTQTLSRRALAKHRVEAAAGADADALQVASCGIPHCGTQIAIVNPQTLCECQENEIGEIWVHGESVARGYWQQEERSQETFGALVKPSGDRRFMRTGDLGFVRDNEVYVTGRIKDLIIIRGQNHYPQDIERTAGDADRRLSPSGGAAFSVEVGHQEKLVIVHELDRNRRDANLSDVMRRMRIAVAIEHEVDVHEIVLIRQASLPRTTSGKVQRFLCRKQYHDGELKELARWGRSDSPDAEIFPPIALGQQPLAESELERLRERIEKALLSWLRLEADAPIDDADGSRPFAEFGVDSMRAVELSGLLEEWLGVELTPILAWQYPTPTTMADYLARKVGGVEQAETPPIDGPTAFERLLAEVEQMQDSEVEARLRASDATPD